ncbi:MAG: PAS domain S-box protein, partial [Coleofasciculaceae cyanobacterium]
IQYGFQVDFGIDQILFKDSIDAVDAAARGRMAPNTATNFLLLGSALVLLHRRVYSPAQFFAIVVFLIAFGGLIGHAYQIPIFYGIGSYTGMAIHTAISFILLSFGLLAACSEWGMISAITSPYAGGIMARQLLPMVLGIPPILGWLVLWGYQANIFYAEFGLALRSILGILIFGTLVWWNALRLNAIDSQRQQFQTALLESERRFRAIFDQTFQFTGLLTPDGILLEANQTALDFGGFALKDVVGKPFWEARWWTLSPQTQEKLQEAIARAKEGEFVRYEAEVQGADNQVIMIDFSLRPILNETGQVILLIPEGRDITERKQAEAQLREAEERFRLAFDDAATGEALVAPDGRFIRVNRALCELVGYSESELLTTTFQEITHPDDLDTDLNYLHQLLAGKRRTYQMEKRYFHKQGQVVWILLSVSLVRDEPGQPLYFIAQIQDITQRKLAEAQRTKLLSELERSNRELEDFAYVVSHDLLSPLHKIQMFNELLVDEYSQVLDSQGREYLERMLLVKEQMQTFIKDLLTLAQVKTQAQPFKLVNLTTLVQEVLSDLSVNLSETGGVVEIGELPTLKADPFQMRQLMQNLLSNALKFHKPETPPRVKIYQKSSTENDKDRDNLAHHYYQIIVEDNGIGFKSEYQEQIFDVFQRLHSRSEYEGTGLGLTICRKIVERHGGSITASSMPGLGATFTIALPINLS